MSTTWPAYLLPDGPNSVFEHERLQSAQTHNQPLSAAMETDHQPSSTATELSSDLIPSTAATETPDALFSAQRELAAVLATSHLKIQALLNPADERPKTASPTASATTTYSEQGHEDADYEMQDYEDEDYEMQDYEDADYEEEDYEDDNSEDEDHEGPDYRINQILVILASQEGVDDYGEPEIQYLVHFGDDRTEWCGEDYVKSAYDHIEHIAQFVYESGKLGIEPWVHHGIKWPVQWEVGEEVSVVESIEPNDLGD